MLLDYYKKNGNILVSIVLFPDYKNKQLLLEVKTHPPIECVEKTFDGGEYDKAIDFFNELVKKIDPDWVGN